MDCHKLVEPRALKALIGDNSLKVFHMNCRSVNNKTDELQCLFDAFNFHFDVIMFSETWYGSESSYFVLKDYTHFAKNRFGRRGGGVSLQVLNTLKITENQNFTLSSPYIEMLTVEDAHNVFSVLYRPPDGDIEKCLSLLEGLLDYVSRNQLRLFLSGDINIDVQAVSPSQKEFISLLHAYGFFNLIDAPTRVTCSSSTTIDIIITNFDGRTTSGTIMSDISDHLPVFGFFSMHSPHQTPTSNPLQYQRIDAITLDRFGTAVSALEWCDVLSLNNVEDSYNALITKIKVVYDKCFPLQRTRKQKARKPWMTYELIRKIKTKDKLFAQFLKSKELSKWQTYKKYRNQLNRELKVAKVNYFKNAFSHSANKSVKNQWDHLNKILNCSSKNIVTSLTKDGLTLSGEDLSNEFNNFFINITETLCCSSTPTNYVHHAPGVSHSLFMFPTTESEIITVFSNLRTSKAEDKDGFQIKPFKCVIDLLAPVMMHIYNLALGTAVFPKQMQVAKVTVIHKGGDASNLSNFRPISILPVLSKGLEKVIYISELTSS